MSGTNELCSFNKKGVNDLEECKMAATKMAYVFQEARDRGMMPPGCYFLPENEKVYFNTHNNYPYGRKSRVAKQICESKG